MRGTRARHRGDKQAEGRTGQAPLAVMVALSKKILRPRRRAVRARVIYVKLNRSCDIEGFSASHLFTLVCGTMLRSCALRGAVILVEDTGRRLPMSFDVTRVSAGWCYTGDFRLKKINFLKKRTH